MKKNNLINFLFIICVFLFIFSAAIIHNTIDMDYWARLIQGNAFWELGHILKTDFYSYMDNSVWIDHEWGSSVVFSFINKFFGYKGIFLLKCSIIFLILLFIYKTIKLQGFKTNITFNILYFLFVFYSIPTITQSALRCHFFTFLFFSFSIYLLEKIRKENKYKLLLVFPFLMLIWVNMHGGCVSLLGILFIYAAGEFLNKQKFSYYIYALLACISVMFINPYGKEFVEFIFMATTMKRPFVTEWISPFFNSNPYFLIIFKIFFLSHLLFLLYSLKKEQKDFTKIILLVVCAYLSFKFVKNTPFFIITASAFLYEYNLKLINSKFLNDKVALVFMFCMFFSSFYIIVNNKIQPNLSEQPYKITEFIKINNLNGKILAPFDMGSYIAYKLYPNNLIYMDGRYEEVYPEERKILSDNFYNVNENWREILKYDHDYIIVPRNAILNDYLVNINKFVYFYADDKNCLYAKKELLKKRYTLPSDNEQYYIDSAFVTNIKFL